MAAGRSAAIRLARVREGAARVPLQRGARRAALALSRAACRSGAGHGRKRADDIQEEVTAEVMQCDEVRIGDEDAVVIEFSSKPDGYAD